MHTAPARSASCTIADRLCRASAIEYFFFMADPRIIYMAILEKQRPRKQTGSPGPSAQIGDLGGLCNGAHLTNTASLRRGVARSVVPVDDLQPPHSAELAQVARHQGCIA